MKKLVQGVGINDGKYPTSFNGHNSIEYALWTNMLVRAYNKKVKDKYNTYQNCTVCENFKHFSYFYDWCHTQIGFNIEGYQLDKDLLTKGNKEYNENNCVFLPNIVNSMLTKSNSTRGDLPIGVSKHGNNFRARCRKYDTPICIGTYKTVEDAFQAYKLFKENYIKELAEKYKATIDPRAYQALMNYEVDIND